MDFVDRRPELQALDRFVDDRGAGMMVLFGRRRIGKTRLLTHFTENCRDIDTLYWTATTQSAKVLLQSLSQAILGIDPRLEAGSAVDFSFVDWEAAFHQLADIVASAQKPRLVVLDEFTYLLQSEPTLTSILQKAWDHRLSKLPQLKLILTGSLVGMMEREVLSAKAPLYGRATSILRLNPLPFGSLVEIFGDRSPAQRVALYAIAGGIPAYLEQLSRSPTLNKALRERCLTSGSIMLTDAALLLHEQLSDPHTYESILWSMAGGFHSWGEIAKMSGVAESSLGYYIKVLLELGLIEKRDPILASPRSRQSRYFVRDPFLRFYYRFIVPQITNIERGFTEAAVERIRAELRGYIGGEVFEALCREWVLAAAAAEKLAFQPEEVGSYWRSHKTQGVQLDVVAANRSQRRLLIGEAKWGRGGVGRKVLTDLVERSRRMPQVAEGWQTTYALFSREGFSAATRKEADRLGAVLISLADLEKVLVDAIR